MKKLIEYRYDIILTALFLVIGSLVIKEYFNQKTLSTVLFVLGGLTEVFGIYLKSLAFEDYLLKLDNFIKDHKLTNH